MKEEKLTSVKVIDELYRKFKEKSIRDDFSLQKLVNRSLDLFVYDEEFQKKILEYDNLEESGSKFKEVLMELPKLKKVSENKKKKILLIIRRLKNVKWCRNNVKRDCYGNIDEYDWVQVGGAIKHPDAGKNIDMNQTIREETGIEDASLKIYPVNGYGSPRFTKRVNQN